MSEAKTAHEKMSSLGARATQQVDGLLDEAQPALSRMSHRIKEELSDYGDSGKEALSDAKHKLEKEARHMRVTTEHFIQHDPIRSVLIASATGAAAALAVSWLMRSRPQ
ncbi:hypothetical protein [uncultured Limnohabitans sp.]|jgi:ElaB/YqjD/DUF883 family membrane-anchored ribosome-binding protein|uniref:hypothetical protein n=1 Tax=uncultured Limnohabitans sp. TaxID=768543 RepID=UPI002606F88E|nr:hypothetical protein [uncultured Limnohabitans sp.]MDP4622211.1 hypothetical protein [Hydrogenophaga sp.]